MNRAIMVAGLHLDRAWTELGSPFGAELRDWSRKLLVLVVEEARRRDVDTLLIVGDLADRSTVLPQTLGYAAQALGAFSGNVLVVPGRRDWTDGNDLYGLLPWAENTTCVSTSSFAPTGVPNLFASAWTSPNPSLTRPPAGPPTPSGVVVRAALEPDAAATLGIDSWVVTSGDTHEPPRRVYVLPDLVQVPGAEDGWGLLLDLDDLAGGAERVTFSGRPGVCVDVDVSSLDDSQRFAAAVAGAGGSPGPVLLRLIGVLPPSLLLPGFGGPDLPTGAVLDLTGLRYGVETPEPTDRSTRAEFLRAMALTRGEARERHQTTALGLRALESSATGV